ANFLPSHEGDSMFDAIVTYLKTKNYPSFIKSTTDAVAARSEFRKKCSTFFLDKSDELLEGRAAGVHRHVLRRGELRTVFRFVHEALGHCSADVCVRVVSPSLWSSENMDLTARDEIKRCGCRKRRSSGRTACNMETARYISLKFIRDPLGGFTIVLRSTSRDVDFNCFQSSIPEDDVVRKERQESYELPSILIDGRYRINGKEELQDVLEKLHVAFVHCAANNLRILFKSRFYCPGFTSAADKVYSRCWFCRRDGRRKHRFFIKCYEYDVIVQGDLNDPSRKFLIKPRGIPPEEAERFITSVLRSCDSIITLNDAANMFDNSAEVLSLKKKKRSNDRKNQEIPRSRLGGSNPTVRKATARKRKKSTTSTYTSSRTKDTSRLIPPSEISLGPSPSHNWSETDSSSCDYGQNVISSSGRCVADERSDIDWQDQGAQVEPVHASTSLQETFSSCHSEANGTASGQICEEWWQDSHWFGDPYSSDCADFPESETIQAESNAYTEDFSEFHPTEGQYLPFLMYYDADCASDMCGQIPKAVRDHVSNNGYSTLNDPLEDLRNLSMEAFAEMFNNSHCTTSVESYDLSGSRDPY
ncbi:hypothetical protein V3C99_001601, partial [Haemonchus contortus]